MASASRILWYDRVFCFPSLRQGQRLKGHSTSAGPISPLMGAQGADAQFRWQLLPNSPGRLARHANGEHHTTFPWRTICCSSEEAKEIFKEREKLNYFLAPAEGLKICWGKKYYHVFNTSPVNFMCLTQNASMDSEADSGMLLKCSTNGFGARKVFSSCLLTCDLLHVHSVDGLLLSKNSSCLNSPPFCVISFFLTFFFFPHILNLNTALK